MTYERQRFTAPDGTKLVVIAESDYERLVLEAALDEDARDIRAADQSRVESDARYPAVVVDHIIAGMTPVAAWRTYRDMTQARLGEIAGVHQTAIARLEKRVAGKPQPLGRWTTRQAIARALDVPVSALDPLDD